MAADSDTSDSNNDCIATQRYPTPEMPIESPVMSRTTSEPSGGRSRMMVAIIAGCRSFRTLPNCHTSISTAAKGYDCAFCDKSTKIGTHVVLYI